MIDVEVLIHRLKTARRGQLKQMARKTGVPYGSIRRIRDTPGVNPRVGTIRKLWSFYPDYSPPPVVLHKPKTKTRQPSSSSAVETAGPAS